MAHNFYTKVSRQRAIEHEKFLSTQSGGIGTFLSKMFNFNKTEIDTSWDNNHSYNDIQSDENITNVENTWLMKRINQNAKTDKYEKAILDFIKQ